MKTNMKKWKNHLDERQEQILLRIESRSCWLAFWGLLAAMVVQEMVYGFEFAHVAGEWIIFMTLAVYLSVSCLKNGIWDRRLNPSAPTNFVLSLLAGLLVGGLVFVRVFSNYPDRPQGAAAAGLILGVAVFTLCFLTLLFASSFYRKRRRQLEAEPELEQAE